MLVHGRSRCLLVAVALACALGCGEEPHKSSPPKDPAPAGAKPAAPADESLTPEEYIALGMPSHDREWHEADMEKAAQVLRMLGEEAPAKLPRYQSARSGAVFTRITNPDNARFFASELPVETKLRMGMTHFNAVKEITKMYMAVDLKSNSFNVESMECLGCSLRLLAPMYATSEDFLARQDPNDPTYPARKKGFEGLSDSFMMMLNGAFLNLGDSDGYTEAARARLLGHFEQVFPDLYRVFPSKVRTEIVVRLRELEAKPSAAFAKDRLRALREKLTVK